MSTHVFSNQCGADPSASEISTTDSLIQEFQEFEAQVYSGSLFDRKCRTSTPSAEIKSSQANQTTNISTRTHSFQEKSYANQKSKGRSDFNETSDIEVDSLDDEPVDHLPQINLISKRTENSDNHSSQITGNNSSPSSPAKVSRIPQLIRPAVKPGSRPTTLNSLKFKDNTNSPVISPQHHFPPQPTVVIPHSFSVTNSNLCSPTTELGTTRASSGRSQYFVPNLLQSPSDMTKSQKFQLKATESNTPTPTHQLSPSVSSINNSRPCNTNRVKVTVKKLAASSSPSQSVNSQDSYGQINKINPDTVASYAQEDPIETHDLVVAKMVADGVVWIPTSGTNSTVNTGTKNCQSMTQKTDQLRWYSEEIEEEKVENISITRSNSIPESRQSMKHHSSGNHEYNLTRGSSLNDEDQPGSELSSYPTSSSTTKGGEKEKNNSFNPQQPVTSESVDKQSELEAKLQEAMIIRKQQDDYIKQLQMYYDNLLTKHALAEVTIDQLRMGMRVGIDVDSIDDTLQKKSTKPRSHSMQTLHYNNNSSINNNQRLISNEDCLLQCPKNCYQNRNNTNDITVHYSSTPLLEQQRNKLRRNSSAHDARVLSTASESWETGLGSVSNNSSQFVQRNNDISKVDLMMKNMEKSTSYGQDHAKPGGSVQKIPTERQQSHQRKISEPSPSPSPPTTNHRGDNDPMKNVNNHRRNTTTASFYNMQQHHQANSIQSPNGCVPAEQSCDKYVGDGVITDGEAEEEEDVFGNTLTNMTTATTTPNHEAQQHQQQQKLHKEDEMNSNSVASDFNTMPLPSAINNSSSNLNEIIYGPETVQMELLLRVADLQTRLSTMELFASQHHFIPESDLTSLQLDYGTLRDFYDSAKIHWGKDPQFDANEVLISELNHMADQLDKLIGYTLNTNETQSLQSSSTSSSPAPHTTVPKPAPRPSSNSASVSDLPASCWKDLNIFKLSDHTSSSEQKPVKNTTDSGVLSSPSSLPRSDHGRLSSISPLQSPIAEDSLSGLESVYFELMQHYNKIKEMPMTPVRAEQLYNLMKRLYDLALTAENRSSIIASPEELERIFQLDGDTRKLSENLERAIALQKQLSNYQNSPPNSESNSLSSHEETNLHKDNNSTTKLSSVSLASYARKGGSQNIKKDSSSSNQDSGLSTPPESSDGMKRLPKQLNGYDSPHYHQHPHPRQALSLHKTSTNQSTPINHHNNSQTDNSYSSQKHEHSDSGFALCPPQPVQPRRRRKSNATEHQKGYHNQLNPTDGQQDMPKRNSPTSYSQTDSYSQTTKQRIDALENGVRMLKENLGNLYLRSENCTPTSKIEKNIKSTCPQSVQQSPLLYTSNPHSSLPLTGINNNNNSELIVFPQFSSSTPYMGSSNGGNCQFLSPGQLNSSSSLSSSSNHHPYADTSNAPILKLQANCNPRLQQDVCENNNTNENANHSSNRQISVNRPCRTYHRTADKRLICTQQNDTSYSSSTSNPQNTGKQYMTLKSNQSTVHGSSNGACKVSQYSANKRDLSYSRPTDRHHRRHSQFNKAADNGIGRSTKYYSTYQLNNRSRDSSSSSSSVSSDYSSDDSPTLASHSSSGECSTSLDDNSDLHRTSRYKVKNRPSLPVSRAYRDPLPDSPVLKSILRDDRFKQQRNSHRSSSLCKPVSHRIPLRSVTNIQDNYGSLNHLNAVPLNQTAHVNSTPNSKPVHNLMNTFGGSVPVVGNPEASGESVYYPSYPLVRQQSSRIYTAFESIHRRPSVPIQPSVYFYPSTERILYSHPVHQTVASEQCHDGGVCSPRIPTNLSNNCVVTSPKPMTCGACGGSGQILGGGGNLPNSRFIEPPLIRPNIGLSPLYRKTLSSARRKESRARPLRATHPCDISFIQSPSSNLFENENVCRNFNTNSTVNPSTHYHEPGRMDYTARFGSLTHVNKRSHSKSLTHRKYSHLMMMNQSNHQNPNTNSSEDSGSGTTSGEKSCCRKQNNRVNDNHHLNSREHYSNRCGTPTPAGNAGGTGIPLLSSSTNLQEILKAVSSTSRLAQKLRCSLEDLCSRQN